jgi:hypothetical protein
MSNITVLIVEKNGDIKESVIKSFNETDLYKKAGFKIASGFKMQASWNIEAEEATEISESENNNPYSISVYGKTDGKANQENKYEFPPPIDNTLFFGNCIIVNRVNGEPANLTSKEWEGIYDYLYGGFEDVGDEDSDDYSEDDDEEEDGKPRTKSGYVKDGFVVDDEEDISDEASDSERDNEDDDEEEAPKKKKPVKKSKQTKPTKNSIVATTKPVTLFERLMDTAKDEQETYLDCTSELSEESYV